MIFNPTRPFIGGPIEIADSMPQAWTYLGTRHHDKTTAEVYSQIVSFKYADIDYVRSACNSDLVRTLLDNAPIEGRHKRILVDVKVHHLKKGQFSCQPGFHLDGSINPQGLDKQPEIHHLFVLGEYARTEFLDTPIDIEVDPAWDFADRSRKIGAILDDMNPQVFEIPNGRFATYDDRFFHRGQRAAEDQIRLLVRVTETDIIQPRNSIFTPTTHP